MDSDFISPKWLQIYFPKSFLWITSVLSSQDEYSLAVQRCVEQSLYSEEIKEAEDSLKCSWWPMTLRKNKAPVCLLELAYYESLLCFLKQNYLGQVFNFSLPVVFREKDKICLNPSLQFCKLTEAAVFLQRPAGVCLLYVILDEHGRCVLKEHYLSEESAVFIEGLQELVADSQHISWQQLSEVQKSLLDELLSLQVVRFL